MRYLVKLEYDGSNYFGWSKQKDKKTIQEHLENKLSEFLNTKIKIYSSGRTDKGVHALNQYFHFDADFKMDLYKFKKILNNRINKDIHIKDIQKVNDNFNARYHVKNKTYLYIINDGLFNPFMRNYEMHWPNNIDIKKYENILNLFIGEYDFSSFSTANIKNHIRKINWIKILRVNEKIVIKINGNGFLRYMVRMIIGYSLLVYEGKRDIRTISHLLDIPNKGKSGSKAKPNGLFLYDVYY